MMSAFLISCALLIVVLIASLFVKINEKVFSAALWGLGALTLFLLAALIVQRLLSTKAAFANPWALLLLILPAAVAAVKNIWKKTYFPHLAYSRTHQAAQSASAAGSFTQWLPMALYTVALILFVLALARPVLLRRTTIPPTQGVDIMLVMDASASMQRQDFYPNRFAAALKTADNFIQKRINDRIGLVVFSRQAMLQAPLTLDHDAVRDLLGALYLGIIDPNYTAIGDAVGVAISHLKDSQAKSKIIILLTDGYSNAGTIDPLLAAQAAASYGIKLYTIATASPPGSGAYSSQEEEINEGLLMEMAQTAGGQFYRAKNELELAKIYDTINELEKTTFTYNIRTNQSDFYFPFILAGLALLAAGLLLEKLFLIRIP